MKFRLIYLFIFFSITSFAVPTDNGDLLFNNKQYSKARAVYEGLLKKRPNDALYNYKYARCCYELKDFEDAIIHFEMSGPKFPLRDLYLGELYFNTYRFDQSIMAYQTYIATLKPDDKKIPEYQQKAKKAELAAHLMSKVEDIAVVDSVVVDKSDFLKYYKFSSELGTVSQELLKLNAHRTFDRIKYTTQRQDRIYFSDSIRGQMDIFTSYKLFDSWSEPTPISELINTHANENYPFLLLDGVTVYFASDGENSIGGYDLFVTRFTPASNSYLPPENIGFPFNSPANDYMMVIDEQRKLGWFATDRNQKAGKVMIYTFVPNQLKMIVHSENKDFIIRAAQLKSYRKVEPPVSDSIAPVQDQQQNVEKQIQFVINDTLVYTSISQFKSDEAVKFWSEMHKLTLDLKSMRTKLDDLRIQYVNVQKDDEKLVITPKILELERKISEEEKLISLKTIQIQNKEIQYLQKAK